MNKNLQDFLEYGKKYDKIKATGHECQYTEYDGYTYCILGLMMSFYHEATGIGRWDVVEEFDEGYVEEFSEQYNFLDWYGLTREDLYISTEHVTGVEVMHYPTNNYHISFLNDTTQMSIPRICEIMEKQYASAH